MWQVGGKVFAIGGWGKDKQPAFTFKTSVQNFHYLSVCNGYRPAPYFATRGMKCIQQTDNAAKKESDLHYYLTASHKLVSLGLSKAQQATLGLNQIEKE